VNIVALYKIFRGREFLEASIASVYNHVDKIVFVSSNIGWDGKDGNNTEAVARAYPDPLKKIVVLKHDTTDQEAQYRIGQQFVMAHYKPDWVLLIDSDEVWTEMAWERAMEYLFNAPADVQAFTCNMHTYIKDVLYMVDDTYGTQVKPTIFTRPMCICQGIRGNGADPRRFMAGVTVHHFALVRDDIDEVFRKMTTSRVGDRYAPPLVHLETWQAEVWDKIPGPAYHYYVGCAGVWQKTIEVDRDLLPYSVRNWRPANG
jgi:glycosyltransferase involved in cell wall biosynthesis